MRSPIEQQDLTHSSAHKELQLLSEVDQNPEVTQRQLSQRMGIALGLTNVLVRNLAQKGYIRVSQASWKRRIYTLTPDGFLHRIRLMRRYINRVLNDYQKIRRSLREELEPLDLNPESRVAICGTGEFAELVYLGLRDIGIEEIEVFIANEPQGQKFLGMPVQDLGTLQPNQYDQVVVALLGGEEQIYQQLQLIGVGPGKLITLLADGKSKGLE